MDLISDMLLVAGSFGAALYCYVLSTRLKKFTTLESGMGGAIAQQQTTRPHRFHTLRSRFSGACARVGCGGIRQPTIG